MTFKEELRDLAQYMVQEAKAVGKFLFDTIKRAGFVWLFVTFGCSVLGYMYWAAFSLIQLQASLLGMYVPTLGITTMQEARWSSYLIIPVLSIVAGMVLMGLCVWSRLFTWVARPRH